MKTASLNLLRYPKHLSGPGSALLGWALAGLLLGVLAGAARGLWSQAQLSDGQRQRQQLQAQREQQSRAAAQASARLQLIQGQQQAQARHAQWESRRAQVLRLHALLGQAGPEAWRLQSLQTLAGGGVELVLEASWSPSMPATEGSRP